MLQSIRNHAQGWIAWVIVGLIILTFALFGIDQYAKGDKIVVVAEVNGEDVTASDFLTLYSRQKARLKNQFGEMYDQVVKDEQLRDDVMDALIESEVVRQWADSHNMMISNQQLSATIESAEVFQKDGKFDQQRYQEILLQNGLNVARFEHEQRQFLIENQNRQLTMASAISSDAQLAQLAALQFQQRDVNYLRVDQRPFMQKAQITEEEIQTYYNNHKEDFITPEQVVLSYVLLSKQDLADKVKVDEEALKQFYQANKDQFTQPEKRQASHILIKVDAESQDADAQKTIKEIQAKLAAGEDFAKLAKTYSDDPGSANMGGDLGLFQQGMMVPAFDKAVFSMKLNEISEPVKTEFGYHLIKLTKIQPKKTQDFADVKAEAEKIYRRQQADKQYFDELEQLNTIAYEQADSLIPAADAVGLEIKTTEPFSRVGGDDDVTSNGKVITAAYSEEVKKSGLNSSAIEISPDASVVIRVKKVIDEKQQTLAEVKVDIEKILKREAGVKASAELAKKLHEQLLKGDQKMADLKKDGVEFSNVGWLERENRRLLPQLTQAIFKAPKPKDGQPTYTIYALPTGDSVVIEILRVKEGSLPDDKAQLAQMKSALVQLAGVSEADARVQAMVAKADIERKENYKTIKSAR
ncbi:SurA N-terminal domain-containing protein [Hydrogenovibrio sp. 3SP14C1]|uniref:SurA N-terminal domain-containing protein n=1 Tax=Hydrogenovibrio sp. 3SP14C1 TaxID=3038774 RepID=UPI00241626F2|nr:SurA N-terminal domain-containing protein [Hydrogenovibrio sp. 3SP14C1]MDG4813394.1 SurA N-terminal domain-containing protein [Hydrogenovibrio sp. 3SP14C1]